MKKHRYISVEDAFCMADDYSSDHRAFFIAIDFELNKALFYPIENIPQSIHIQCDEFRFNIEKAQSEIKRFGASPISFETYKKGYSYIKQEIQAGNSYLVNYTASSDIISESTLTEIFNFAHARYKLLIDNEFAVFSPESFISINKGIIATFPMKGTIDAELPDAENTILSDPKEQAEHATIVDLLRNDLSKVSSSVSVKRYRYIEKVTSAQSVLLQVSSEITGKLLPDYDLRIGSILRQLLPAGSVSGAPKTKTLDIISKAEHDPRGFYCGIMGVFNGETFTSGVLIRYLEQTNSGLKYRSGGGITHMSKIEDEYVELIKKIYVPTT